MKKKISYLLLITFYSIGAFAQDWSFYKAFPVNVSPLDIDINSSGTLYMLTTDGRIFYKPMNQEWNLMTDPSGFGPISPQEITINKSSNTLIVAEGLGGGIKRTSNFGNSWQSNFIFTNPISGLHESVYELSNVSANNTFYSQIILGDFVNRLGKFTNNGQNIEFIQYDPSNSSDKNITELHVTSNNTLLIGTWNSGIIISNNGGQSFQQSNFNQHQIYKITEDNLGRVYALGYNLANDELFLIHSIDYINWSFMDLPNSSERFTCLFYDSTSQFLWLGSETGLYRKQTYSSSGTQWSSAVFNNSTQNHVAIIGDSAGNVYNFSFESNAQKLNSNGNSWLSDNDGFTGTSNFIRFGANDKLFSANISNNSISSLENQNANWSTRYLGGNSSGVNNFFSTTEGKIYVNLGLSLKKSIDNGITYSDITPLSLNNFISKFYLGENNTLFLVKSNEINNLYISLDDGASWSLSNTFADPIDDIAQDSNGVMFVTVSNFDVFSGFYTIYFSSNNGLSWDSVVNTIPVEVGAVSDVSVFSKFQNTYIAYGGYLHLFDLQSNTLFPINSPNNTPQFEGGFYIDNANNFYVFADFLYKSTNGGASWYSLSRPTSMVAPYFVDSVVFDSSNNPFIVTSSTANAEQNGIYRVFDNLSLDDSTLDETFVIYPNPAKELISISNSDTIKNVTFYDITGKRVDINLLSNNVFEISNLSDGIYFVKLIDTSDQIRFLRFIKN